MARTQHWIKGHEARDTTPQIDSAPGLFVPHPRRGPSAPQRRMNDCRVKLEDLPIRPQMHQRQAHHLTVNEQDKRQVRIKGNQSISHPRAQPVSRSTKIGRVQIDHSGHVGILQTDQLR
jgi:hypothetical protein